MANYSSYERFHWFSYQGAPRETREKIETAVRYFHQVRDGAAMLEIADVLRDNGLKFGKTYFNGPNMPQANTTQGLTKNDLLVLTTRPPITDEEVGNKKSVQRSHTDLEKAILSCIGERFFTVCDRSQVQLTKRWEKQLLPGFKKYASIEFLQRRGASFLTRWIKQRAPIASPDETAGYLCWIPEAWESGPAILSIFGLGGPETLAWAHLLRTQYHAEMKNILFSERDHLLMVKWSQPALTTPPSSLDLVSSFSATNILLNKSL